MTDDTAQSASAGPRDGENPPNRVSREHAKEEYRLYKEHGRPSRPYHFKCLECGEIDEIDGSLLDADHDARRHAGYHGGWKEEDAEIVVTDSCGKELFRFHALFKPNQNDDLSGSCPGCGEEVDHRLVSCPHCGYIPEEARA